MPIGDYLPRNRINLVSGVRDAGKTRFILPAMKAWRECPPWAYIAADRSINDALDTIRDLKYAESDIPLVPAYGSKRMKWHDVIISVSKRNPLPEILVIEAFQDFSESINRREGVHAFMNNVDAYCAPSKEFPKGLTILGITGAPKQSMRDRYPDPTQRVPGTSIWVERASTIFIVESAEKDLSLTNERRILYIARKHGGPRLQLPGEFDAFGRLIFPEL